MNKMLDQLQKIAAFTSTPFFSSQKQNLLFIKTVNIKTTTFLLNKKKILLVNIKNHLTLLSTYKRTNKDSLENAYTLMIVGEEEGEGGGSCAPIHDLNQIS